MEYIKRIKEVLRRMGNRPIPVLELDKTRDLSDAGSGAENYAARRDGLNLDKEDLRYQAYQPTRSSF